MRKWLTSLAAAMGVLVVPGVVWGQAALTNATFQQTVSNDYHKEAVMIRCDVSGGIADPGVVNNRDWSWIGGEGCVTGDWTNSLDCRDMKNLTVYFFEYGTGSADAKIWDCLSIPGHIPNAPSTVGGTVPSTEDPSGTPSAADPDPLCVSLDDAASVTIDGNNPGVQLFRLDNQNLHYIVGEINTCTGNCDSTLVVSCGR